MKAFDGVGCRVIVDERHYPIIIFDWQGATTEDVARRVFANSDPLLRRAREEKLKVSIVAETARSGRPDASTRKAMSALSDAQQQEFEDVFLFPAHVVLENPVLRGALSALNWISRRKIEVVFCRDLPSAIAMALASLDAIQQARPPGLDPATYAFPDIDASPSQGG